MKHPRIRIHPVPGGVFQPNKFSPPSGNPADRGHTSQNHHGGGTWQRLAVAIRSNASRRLAGMLASIVAAGALMAPGLEAQVPDDIFDEEPLSASPPIADPLEILNRYIFDFNDQFYEDLLRPAANAYTAVVPPAPRRGISNFFRNLRYPERLVGNVLQGNFEGATRETTHFLVNTLAGLGGLFDAAGTREEEHFHAEDLDRAFASWGIGPGAYLVLPVIGPSSIRQSIADGLAAYFLYPPAYLDKTAYSLAVGGFDSFNQAPHLMDTYFSAREGAIDPYIAVREFHVASRMRGMRDAETPAFVRFLHEHQATPRHGHAAEGQRSPADKRRLPARAQRPGQRRWW